MSKFAAKKEYFSFRRSIRREEDVGSEDVNIRTKLTHGDIPMFTIWISVGWIKTNIKAPIQSAARTL
jgi:hypothetical protein